MNETTFKEYFARLRKEAWLKAFIAGLILGFSVLFVSSLVIWLTEFKFVWLAPILWVAATGLATVAFYFWKFNPSKKFVAQRMDSLGLEERVLTMVEFENSDQDSYILRRQREDALAAIGNISAKLIKFAIPVAMVVAVSVCAVLGMGMTTVSALSEMGVIKSGSDVIEEIVTPDPAVYEITYEVEGEGFINGELFLIDTVTEGEDGIMVIAEEADGWVFAGWSVGEWHPKGIDVFVGDKFVTIIDTSDLESEPVLQLTNVQSDMHFVAVFIEGEPGDEGEPGEGEEGDQSQNGPKQPSEEEGDQPGDPGEAPPSPSDGQGGQYVESNQIIDGETYYGGSTFDNAFDTAMGETAGNGNISGDGQSIIGGYMNGIQQ